MRIHNSCIGNGDNLSLLTKAGDAHKLPGFSEKPPSLQLLMGAYFRWTFMWCQNDIPVPVVFLFHLSINAICKIKTAKQMRTLKTK